MFMGNDKRNIKKSRLTVKTVGIWTFLLVFIAFMFVGASNYYQEKRNIIENFQRTSMQIRDSIISQIHYESFSEIVDKEDMSSDIYRSLQEKLNSIRVATSARYLYTAQAQEDGTYIYVVDGLPLSAEDFAYPGTPIEEELFDYMERGLRGESMMSEDFMDTDWGRICTAYFPIYDEGSDVYGILCMEFDMEVSIDYLRRFVLNFAVLAFTVSLLLTALVVLFYGKLRKAQEEAQNAYTDANLRLETILNGISGGFKISRDDEKYSFAHVSEAAAAIQGYTVEEFLQVSKGNLADNIYQSDRESTVDSLKEQEKRNGSYSCKYRVLHKDGSVKWVVDSGKRIVNENGETLYYSLYQDVTDFEEQNHELRKTMAMLDQERRQYRDALTNRCEYSYAFDVTEGLIYNEFTAQSGVNLIRELGLPLPVSFDLMNQKWTETKNPRMRSAEMRELLKCDTIRKRFQNGERTVEIEYYSPEAETYTRVTTLLSQNEQNGHIQGFVIGNDITELRKAEEQKKWELLEAKKALEEAYERANYANAAKSDFLSNMSHDIRTPMNAIIGMTAIAATNLDDRERVSDCLNKISISSKHLLGLINEILDMSKIESGKMDLRQEEFSLADLIDNLITMSKTQAEEKQHELSISTWGIVHEKVVGDAQRLLQALMNLMSNAIKYTPDGGRIQVNISEKRTNRPKIGCYEFIFEDNGIGMEEEYLEHLFEPFSRADDSRVRKMQGTGLGMPITKNIIQMMNGSIQVESSLGKGTKFTVTVFMKLQDAVSEVSYQELVDLPILVVDDEEIACEATCEILRQLGMKGEWVLSGREAVERAVARHNAQDDFFALILDWKMPEMDGVATAREIRRQIGEDIPIIILSAYDWSDIEAEAREAGVNAFICKPLFKSRVVQTFRCLLGHEEEQKRTATLDEFSEDEFAGKHALLAEDNEINAEIASEIFGMMGLEVDWVQNGKEAVDTVAAAEAGSYDVIFMDIQMPVMNGYEATKAIRALPGEYAKDVPIIAMTANAFAEDVQAAHNAGMNEHITKPLDLEQLMQALKKWL